MKFSIREAELKDAVSLAELSGQLGYATDSSLIQNRLTPLLKDHNHCVFTAVTNDQVIGWIHGFYAMRVESEPFVEIGGLVVSDDHRQKGIGKELVKQVAEWCRLKGCVKLRVRCNVIRTDSHQFYEKIGFATNKEQKVLDKPLAS